MELQSCRSININALRLIPYATLIRAMSSCFMLISMGTACLSSAGIEGHRDGIFISACLIGMVAVLGNVLAINCLCKLQDMADEFKTVVTLLVIEGILRSVIIFICSEGFYQSVYGLQRAIMTINLAKLIVYISEQIIHAIALFTLMKGLAGILSKTGGKCKLAGNMEYIGAIYIASVVFFNIVISIAYAKEESIGIHFLLISFFIWTLLETAFFLIQRKATVMIWQGVFERNSEEQGDKRKEEDRQAW